LELLPPAVTCRFLPPADFYLSRLSTSPEFPLFPKNFHLFWRRRDAEDRPQVEAREGGQAERVSTRPTLSARPLLSAQLLLSTRLLPTTIRLPLDRETFAASPAMSASQRSCPHTGQAVAPATVIAWSVLNARPSPSTSETHHVSELAVGIKILEKARWHCKNESR
jgi:hypothetical protein